MRCQVGPLISGIGPDVDTLGALLSLPVEKKPVPAYTVSGYLVSAFTRNRVGCTAVVQLKLDTTYG